MPDVTTVEDAQNKVETLRERKADIAQELDRLRDRVEEIDRTIPAMRASGDADERTLTRLRKERKVAQQDIAELRAVMEAEEGRAPIENLIHEARGEVREARMRQAEQEAGEMVSDINEAQEVVVERLRSALEAYRELGDLRQERETLYRGARENRRLLQQEHDRSGLSIEVPSPERPLPRGIRKAFDVIERDLPKTGVVS